jgi:hypothetical protein
LFQASDQRVQQVGQGQGDEELHQYGTSPDPDQGGGDCQQAEDDQQNF